MADIELIRSGEPHGSSAGETGVNSGGEPRTNRIEKSGRPGGSSSSSGRRGAPGYREKISRHRRRILRLQILVIFLLAASVVLVVWLMHNRRYTKTELTRIRDLVAEEGSQYLNLNGHIVQYGPNGAVCIDSRGRTVWNITYEMDRPIVSTAENVLAIADYGGREIYVLNTQKQLGVIETNLPIHMLAASACGEVAAVTDDATTTWVRLYSSKGDEIAYFVRSMAENGYPVGLAVSPDGEQVCMSCLRMQDSAARTYISFYDFSSAGMSYKDHQVGIYDFKDEVFPYIYYMDSSTCVAASDARVIFFDVSGVEPVNGANHMFKENLQGIFGSKDYMGLLFSDLTGKNLYRLDLYDRSGRQTGSLGFSLAFNRIRIEKDRIYINNERSCHIYNKDGQLFFSGGFDRAVKILIPSSRVNRMTAVSENEVDAVRLR